MFNLMIEFMKRHDQLTEDLILLQRLRYLAQRYESNTYEWLMAYEANEDKRSSDSDRALRVDKIHDKFTTIHNCVVYLIEELEKDL